MKELSPEKERIAQYCTLFLILVIVHLYNIYQAGFSETEVVFLAGPDSYMRVNRIIHLITEWQWFNDVFPRIFEGHIQHWTRPLDILILFFSSIFHLFMESREAVMWGGFITGPILHFVCLLTLLWSVRPIFSERQLFYTACFFVIQGPLFVKFMPGNADQHSLIAVLCAWLFGLTLRMINDHTPNRYFLSGLAGLVAALSIWTSIETMLLVVISYCALGCAWLLQSRKILKVTVCYAISTLLFMALALAIERVPDFLNSDDYDRISLNFVILFGINALFWIALYGTDFLYKKAKLGGRILQAAILVPVALAGIWLWIPGFIGSPLDNVDPLYERTRLINITELLPILQDDIWATLREVIIWLAILVLTLPYLLWQLLVRRDNNLQIEWILFLSAISIYGYLSLYELRWTNLAVLFAIPVLSRLITEDIGRFARITVIAFVVMLPLVFSIEKPDENQKEIWVREECPVHHLSEIWPYEQQPKLIMAFVDFGSELLFRTPHRVMSMPNHRPQKGYSLTFEFMTAADDENARRILHENGVDYVLLCKSKDLESFYGEEKPAPTYQALFSGDTPHYLEKVALPEKLAQHFMLYETVMD